MSPRVGSQRYGSSTMWTVAVAHGQPVVGGRPGHHPGEQAGVVHPDQGAAAARRRREHPHLVGVRAQDPDHRAVRVRVRAEHRVRVVVGAAEQRGRWCPGRAGRGRSSGSAVRGPRPGLIALGRPRCAWLRSVGAPLLARSSPLRPGEPVRNAARSSMRSRTIATTRAVSLHGSSRADQAGGGARGRAGGQALDRRQRDRHPGRAAAGLVERPRRRPCPARRRAAAAPCSRGSAPARRA